MRPGHFICFIARSFKLRIGRFSSGAQHLVAFPPFVIFKSNINLCFDSFYGRIFFRIARLSRFLLPRCIFKQINESEMRK